MCEGGMGPLPRTQPPRRKGGRKISTRYKEAAEAIPSNYVLLSSGGKVRADNNRGDRSRWHQMQRNCHSGSEGKPGEVHDSREADSKWGGAGSQEGDKQQGEGQMEYFGHPAKKVGLTKLKLLRRLVGREANDIMGDMA